MSDEQSRAERERLVEAMLAAWNNAETWQQTDVTYPRTSAALAVVEREVVEPLREELAEANAANAKWVEDGVRSLAERDKLRAERDGLRANLTAACEHRDAALRAEQEAEDRADALAARLDVATGLVRRLANGIEDLPRGMFHCNGQDDEHEDQYCEGDGPDDECHALMNLVGEAFSAVGRDALAATPGAAVTEVFPKPSGEAEGACARLPSIRVRESAPSAAPGPAQNSARAASGASRHSPAAPALAVAPAPTCGLTQRPAFVEKFRRLLVELAAATGHEVGIKWDDVREVVAWFDQEPRSSPRPTPGDFSNAAFSMPKGDPFIDGLLTPGQRPCGLCHGNGRDPGPAGGSCRGCGGGGFVPAKAVAQVEPKAGDVWALPGGRELTPLAEHFTPVSTGAWSTVGGGWIPDEQFSDGTLSFVRSAAPTEPAPVEPTPPHVCKCKNDPCPVCGGHGPSGEWFDGSEVTCEDCGAALTAGVTEECKGSSSFSIADIECDACLGDGSAEYPGGNCPRCNGVGTREPTLAEARAQYGVAPVEPPTTQASPETRVETGAMAAREPAVPPTGKAK